jgi:two-component system, cell cycle sensor histidine kinase and response regulator CckA
MMPSCLIVDDEQSICLLIHDFLNGKGCHVSICHTKAQAFKLVASEKFDVVLVDKNLPDGSGMEVAAEIRRLNLHSEIIIITGYSDLESAIEAVSLGVFRYIKKPFDLKVLEAEIQGALETGALKEKLATRTAELEDAVLRLTAGEKRFRELSDLLPGIVIEVDARGKLLFANRAGLAGLGLDFEALSEQLASGEIFTSACRDAWNAYAQGAHAGETLEVREYEILRADGSVMPVLAQAAPTEKDGRPDGYRALFLDITRRKKTEEALRRKEAELLLSQKMEAVGTLTGGVAHDFNNMLGVIRGFSDVVLLDLDEENPSREDIEGIIDATERASDLTRRLLAFGRKQGFAPKVLNLNAVVWGMEKMFFRLLPENITLETRLSSRAPYVFADKSRLEQVLLNLVVNAKDAMPFGGALIIETHGPLHREDGTEDVALRVTDTGVGMDEQTRHKIFDPFFTTKNPGKGTGLGLATVLSIVEQSGGSICVQSTPGKGAQFEILLPLSKKTASRASSVPPEFETLSGNETVLVVEDEAMLLRVVARLLRSFGYTVLTAAQPGDALLLCEKHEDPIDLLLTDVVMPRMNGAELAERLRTVHPEMRVLYMSGYSDFITVRQVMKENTDRFISKPFRAADLAAKVRAVLSVPDAHTR